MSKMIDKRNELFTEAVDDLLVASEAQGQDPVELLQAATHDHLPVRPDDAEGQRPLADHRADLDFFLKHPENRPSIEQLLLEIKDEEFYDGQIVPGGHRTVLAREPKYGVLDQPLSQAIMDALYATKKITQLFTHQAEAINHLDKGESVIVSTSTSSGKSLIYQLPAMKAFEQVPGSTAMYIFPTKALAQDQKRSLMELLAACEGMDQIKIATFDGDTPKEDRTYIRDNALVIFTNPDMLHITILPKEEEWRRFFQNLHIVVVDGEQHRYSGLVLSS
jgi:DEAD/DEAH box helicase domain-containing protein